MCRCETALNVGLPLQKLCISTFFSNTSRASLYFTYTALCTSLSLIFFFKSVLEGTSGGWVSLAFYMVSIYVFSICESYDDILRWGWWLECHIKENTEKAELICVCPIHTSRLGAKKYEYTFLGNRQKWRKLLYLGPMGQYWIFYGH